MKEHFSQVNAMKAAVVRGEVAEFRVAAELLATRQLSGDVASQWKVHLQTMQNAAGVGRDASDIEAASTALGGVGRACASCHRALGGPKVEVGTPPAEGSGVNLHMVRHQWAVDRMWEGLMGPSDEAWLKGSEALGDAPLRRSGIVKGKTVTEHIAVLAKETHALANRARTAPVDERGKHYGALLATCASCHAPLEVKIK
jgi:cytochrome c553